MRPVSNLEKILSRVFARKEWTTTAVPLLQADQRVIATFLASEGLVDSDKQLVRVASGEVGLGKNLDGFRFDFAGASFEAVLDEQVHSVVIAAWEVVRALEDNGNPV